MDLTFWLCTRIFALDFLSLHPLSKLKLIWRESKCFLYSGKLSSLEVWGPCTALLCFFNLTDLEPTWIFSPFSVSIPTGETDKPMTWNWSPPDSEADKFLLVLPLIPWLEGVKVFSFSLSFPPSAILRSAFAQQLLQQRAARQTSFHSVFVH